MSIPDHFLMANSKGRYKYPFATMKVGEYFVVNIPDVAYSATRAATHHSKVNPGKRFSVLRYEGEGWRVYRTA